MSNVNGDLDTSPGAYGVEDDRRWGTCPGCNGTGEAYMGRFSPHLTTCRECLGSGEVEIDK